MIKLLDILSENIKKRLVNEDINIKFPSPLPGITYTYNKSEYDWNAGRDYGKHKAADIEAPSGTIFRSPMNATVTGVDTSYSKSCGGFIRIKNSDNLVMSFCHVREFFVDVGDIVNAGDALGEVGGDVNDKYKGRSTGPHLHFKIRTGGSNGTIVKPWDYIDFTKGFDDIVNSKQSKEYERPKKGTPLKGIRIQHKAYISDEELNNIKSEIFPKFEEFIDNNESLANYEIEDLDIMVSEDKIYYVVKFKEYADLNYTYDNGKFILVR
jgi:hypothetical protein